MTILASRTIHRLTTMGMKKSSHVTRYHMYNYLSQYQRPRPIDQRALSISRSQDLCKILGFSDEQILDVQYPDVNILCLPFDNEEFDAV